MENTKDSIIDQLKKIDKIIKETNDTSREALANVLELRFQLGESKKENAELKKEIAALKGLMN